MKFGLAAITIAATLLAAQPAPAGEPSPSVAEAQGSSSDSAQRVTLVRRYFVAIQFDKLMNNMLEAQLDAMMVQSPIPADNQTVFRESALAAYAVVIPRMVEESIQMYAEAFTRDELEQLVAFYESPVGLSMTRKTVMLTRNTGEIMQRYTPQMQEEIMSQLCKRIDCAAEGVAR